ncbi:MAG TPA: amidohydrolase family protein [Longimicrobiaceae bacterium]
MSRSVRALYRADWVLPVTAPPIRNGAVLVDDAGCIAAVGPQAAIEPPQGIEIIELGEAILLPGLINAHAHAELAMFRGALEDLPFCDWIVRLVGAKRGTLQDEDYRWAARWTMVEALRVGITTIACTESSTAAVAALREAGMRGIVYQEVFGPDPADAESAIRGLRERVEALRRDESADDLVRVGISPHAPYTVSDRLYRLGAELAIGEGFPMALHIAESAAERALVANGGGDFQPGLNARGIATPVRAGSPIELLDRLGVLRARPLLIHVVDVDDEDVRRIGASGSSVAHCPIANARLGHGIAPVTEMRAAGVPVALGTDSVGSNNRLDLLEEARVASILQRARLRTPAALGGEELLRMCTLEGARALGIEHRVGALQPGLEADLCAVSLRGVHARPVHDPLAALFHSTRGCDVILTVVRGRVLYNGERVLTVDEEATRSALDGIARRMGER